MGQHNIGQKNLHSVASKRKNGAGAPSVMVPYADIEYLLKPHRPVIVAGQHLVFVNRKEGK